MTKNRKGDFESRIVKADIGSETHPAIEAVQVRPSSLRVLLTAKQTVVIDFLRIQRVTRTNEDGSVLRALEKKGLVMRHHNSAPGHIFYTWTLTDNGRVVANQLQEETK